jgi:fucose permease
LLLYCFLSFVVFGAALVLVGANQADLAQALDLDLSRSGLLVSALMGGLGIGVVVAGPLFDRVERRPLFVGAMLLAAAALLSVDREMGFGRALLLLAVTGAGIGAYDTLISAAVSERFGEHSARPMTLVHAGATLGAVAGPLLAGWLAARGDWSDSFRWTGVAHLALAGAAFAVRFAPPDRSAETRAARGRSGLLSAALLPFALISFAYVGVEGALTVFAMPYAGEGLGLDASRGRPAISAFYLGLFIGRLGIVLRGGALGAGVLLACGLVAAGVLGGGVAAAVTQVELVFGLYGAALGCVFPVMIALAGQRLPHARGTAVGLVAGVGCLGGFAIPWLTGAIGDSAGAAIAVGSLALWTLLIAVAAFAARR